MKLSDSSPCLGGGGGGGDWPPGFRFHPTDEELVLYYLKRKICHKKLKLDIIGDIDVYKWDPEQLPGQSKLKSGDKQWFFFSPRDRKYPNGSRSNRATRHGYWKATGKDRLITYNSRLVGVKKTLVFYRGRAPTGKRTDWVMHEYVLDEEELNRCQAVKDCYVLYKLYKKSGPGPKNGEQYGAPFKEEEWADDEGLNNVKDVDTVDTIRGGNLVPSSPLNDFEEFMSRIADEPLQIQPFTVDYTCSPDGVVGEEEGPSTMLGSSLGEHNLCERSVVLHPNSQQCDVPASFDLIHLGTSQSLLHEAPEVNSAPNGYGQQSHVVDKDFFEDFLEMDDLIGPEPTPQKFENPVENFQLDEIDGLSEFDLYHDAAMFLREMVPVDQVSVSDQCLNNSENGNFNPLHNLDNGMVNPVSHLYLNNLENDFVNSVSHPLSNNLNNHTINRLDDANYINSTLWTHEERVFAPAGPDWRTTSQSISGVEYADNPSNLTSGSIENQNNCDKEDDGTDSWFSSALWGFVESIPTTPASASEKALLVNKAFERVSSFGRLRRSAVNTNVSTGNPTTSRRSSGNYNRGFLCFSVVGVLCAVLWMLIGTSVKVLGRCLSS